MSRAWLIVAIALLTILPLVDAREIDGEGTLVPRAFWRDWAYEPPAAPATNMTAPLNETTAAPGDANATSTTADNNETWPRNGSYARYTTHTIGSARGGLVSESFGNATWTYRDGYWVLDCSGSFDTEQSRISRTPRSQSGAFERTRVFPGDRPPLVSLSTTSNFFSSTPRVEAWKLDGCAVVTYSVGSSWNYFTPSATTTWDAETGLLQTWSSSRGSRIDIGTLVATDAPGVAV